MTKPRINPPLTKLDIFLEAIAIIGLIYMIVQIIVEFPNVESEVATHFNASGQPDSWGDKSTLLIIPVITIALYALLTIINRYPHLFNFPAEITEANAPRQYQIAKTLVIYLKAYTIGLFLYIQLMSINVTAENGGGLGKFFIVIVILGSLLPIVIYFVMASRQPND